MQQLYRFRRLFWFSIPFWVMSLFGCLPEKTSPAEKAELSTNTESSTKPEILWKTTATGSGEESHGHFLLSCSDGGFLQIGETGSLPTNARILVMIDEFCITFHNSAFEWGPGAPNPRKKAKKGQMLPKVFSPPPFPFLYFGA